MAKNGTIGAKGHLPWQGKQPAEVAYFRKTTEGSPVVMGSSTARSLGAPLENRRNISLSFDCTVALPPGFGCETSLDKIIAQAKTEDVYVIGGGQVFGACMPFADELLLSVIQSEYPGDVSFPEVSVELQLVSESYEAADEENVDAVLYQRYVRSSGLEVEVAC